MLHGQDFRSQIARALRVIRYIHSDGAGPLRGLLNDRGRFSGLARLRAHPQGALSAGEGPGVVGQPRLAQQEGGDGLCVTTEH